MSIVEEMEAYRKIIRENISYECFEDSRYRQQEEVDELVELMVEVMVMPDNSTVRIGGVDKPVVIVKNRFMKVEHGHIEYVVGCLEKNTSKVGNIRAYLLTTLYNSTMTIEICMEEDKTDEKKRIFGECGSSAFRDSCGNVYCLSVLCGKRCV